MTKKRMIKTGVLLLITASAMAFVNLDVVPKNGTCGEPEIKVSQGKMNFSISHGHCSLNFTGEMEELDVMNSGPNPAQVEVNFKINTNTLFVPGSNTDWTDTVRAADMFDGSGNQFISFTTEDVYPLGKDWFMLKGNLTIKDTKREAWLRATPVYRENIVTEWIIDGWINLDHYGFESKAEHGWDLGHALLINFTALNNGC